MGLKFGHLHLHTEFSFLDSVLHITNMVEKCKTESIDCVAMTDHGSIDGALRFYNACKKENIQPIIGCEFYIVDDLRFRPNKGEKEHRNHLIVLSKTFKGMQNIMKCLTKGNQEGFYYKPRIDWDTVFENIDENNIVLSACSLGMLSRGDWISKVKKFHEKFKDDFYLEIQPFDFEFQHEINKKAIGLSQKYGIKTVFTNDVHYLNDEDEETQQVALAVAMKKKWNDQDRWKFDVKGLSLKNKNEMIKSLKNCNIKQSRITACLKSIDEIIEKCKDFKIDKIKPILPTPYPNVKDENQYFKDKIYKGAVEKGFDLEDPIVKERLEKEINSIITGGFVRYFFIVEDLINWCKKYMAVGPGRGCFHPNTNILLYNKTTKKINKIEKCSDLVKTENGQDHYVEMIWDYDCDEELLSLKFDGIEEELILTKDHKIFKGLDYDLHWVKADDLDIGEYVLGRDNDGFLEVYKITHKKYIKYKGKVYDLKIHKEYSYVANNIIVHNSVGGSLVAYCLNITKVNPLKYDLIFERFISEGRIDLPDIDMDFQDDKRWMVVKYLEDKYGYDCVSHVSNYAILKGRSAVRDVSRVFNVPIPEVDKATKCIMQRTTGDMREQLTVIDSFNTFEDGKAFKRKYPLVVHHASKMEGIIRQGMSHAAGVIVNGRSLMSGEQCSILRRGKYDKVICWDKKDLEHFGLCKLDILGLSALAVIRETQELANIPESKIDELIENPDDPEIYKMLNDGFSSGVFQLNTYGMKDFLHKIGVERFKDICDITSLFRPGPLRTGLAEQYKRRKHGEEEIIYMNDIYERLTKDTRGVVLYQEQIMYFLYEMAGLGWRTCDSVRKAISKSQGKLAVQKFREDFIKGCLEKKTLTKKKAEELFDKIEVFGSYCVSGDTVVYEAVKDKNGRSRLKRITMKEAYEKQITRTNVFNEETGKAFIGDVNKVFYNGKKSVYQLRIKTESNKYRTIKSTNEHKFLTDKGWLKLKDISVGDKVLAKRLSNFESKVGVNNPFYGKETWNKGKTYKQKKKNLITNFQKKMMSKSALKRISGGGMTGKKHNDETKKKLLNASIKGHTNKKLSELSDAHKLLVKNMIRNHLYCGFKHEVNLGNYVFDLVNKKKGIIIEVDGEYWHGNEEFVDKRQKGIMNEIQIKNKKRDYEKDEFANKNGYKILRFWDTDIKNNIVDVLEKIERTIMEYSENPFNFYEVVDIEYIGEEDVYDMSINGNHNNYVANLFVVHNSFNLSHAVEYSLITYITAWLKYYYPVEFLCACLNHRENEDRKAEYVEEIKRLEIPVEYPDINISEREWTANNGRLFMGLKEIKQVGDKSIDEILLERKTNGLFKDKEDFLKRVNKRVVNKRVVENLEKCNALFNKGENDEEIIESVFKFKLNFDESKRYRQYLSRLDKKDRELIRDLVYIDSIRLDNVTKYEGRRVQFPKEYIFGKAKNIKYTYNEFMKEAEKNKDAFFTNIIYTHLTDLGEYIQISFNRDLYFDNKEYIESLAGKWVVFYAEKFYDGILSKRYSFMGFEVWDFESIFNPNIKPRVEFPFSIIKSIGKKRNFLLEKIREENEKCSNCIYSQGKNPVPIEVGKSNALIIAEAPGFEENKTGKPLVGKAGKLFWKYMEEAGLGDRDKFCITHVMKCQPPNNKIGDKKCLKKCYTDWLNKEIEILNPSIILCLGRTAIDYIGKKGSVFDISGNVEWDSTRKCFIVYSVHPSACLYSAETIKYLKKGIESFRNMLQKI